MVLRMPCVPETAAVLALLARRLGGRTLGLFTSLRRMNQVAELLDQMPPDGEAVLWSAIELKPMRRGTFMGATHLSRTVTPHDAARS